MKEKGQKKGGERKEKVNKKEVRRERDDKRER